MRKPIAFLAMLLVFCIGIPQMAFAAAEDDVIQPRWTYLSVVSGNIDISTDGVATVTASVRAVGTVEKVSVVASLQQKKSGTWSEIKSWTDTKDSYSINMRKTWPVLPGYDYRVVITGKAMQGLRTLEQANRVVDYGYFA